MRTLVFVLSVAATIASFASSPASSSPTTAPGDESAFCAMRRAVCERQVACGVYLMSRATSVESCLGQLACEAQERAARASGVSLDVARIHRCTAALKAASCAELTPFEGSTESTLLAMNDDCATALTGTRGAGESCVMGSQCGTASARTAVRTSLVDRMETGKIHRGPAIRSCPRAGCASPTPTATRPCSCSRACARLHRAPRVSATSSRRRGVA